MTAPTLTLLVAALILLTPLWLALGRWLRRRWRRRQGPRRLDAGARALLAAHCPLYQRAPPGVRRVAEERTLELLDELRFIGCRGLVVTDAMRLVIAFQTALLLGRFGAGACAELGGVLLYPASFLAPRSTIDDAGVVTEGQEALSGETLDTARIVLSWADVELSLREADGYNVVLHEFAHFLDHALDGRLSAPEPGETWHGLLEREYAALCAAVESGQPTLIDPYGAEDPAEFFAVATEVFLERPRELAAYHRELYRALAHIYALDPAGWS
jgi:Mlc titration factor MtfA (ptsG expression regulator)